MTAWPVIVAFMAAFALAQKAPPEGETPDGETPEIYQPGIADLAAREARQAGDVWRSKPALHPESGSYFQFVRDLRPGSPGVTWAEADQAARAERFQGRPGRLAVIVSAAQYQWLLTAFPPNESSKIWLGLRYWCANRRLSWGQGIGFEQTGFGAWDTPWHREDGIRCGLTRELPYMGVFIDPKSQLWRATGYRKRFRHYIVEYPAPADSQRPRADEHPGAPRA
ncbi:hypothetical protein EV659_1082 [Rhodothalassium salexigens DSM 2132]|uniref:C-type lectin domain-containing protein n=1 Tax=Rhodothalassium salexigens DSM 2132 TaxID=1188247 RepID=A0A4R2PCJ8_RHOSA|nr:C-type lectin domain-containing protein [Rhodothalassium salexigens]MBB4212026.1 hypothetical protein [Rhodothalassium salexigens DSM 2132]MBK1638118.1 hypothetical protein [Rhodothalassium salexigens DSM 2132]TCP32903.1 hypothetical protein EV659_1082 [Rhodothalassium salexigens DSM 2132]